MHLTSLECTLGLFLVLSSKPGLQLRLQSGIEVVRVSFCRQVHGEFSSVCC